MPFLTVSETLRALPSAPPGNTWTLIRPSDRNASFSAKALAPMSISGPPGRAVVIFQLTDWAAAVCTIAGAASSPAPSPAVPRPDSALRRVTFKLVIVPSQGRGRFPPHSGTARGGR